MHKGERYKEVYSKKLKVLFNNWKELEINIPFEYYVLFCVLDDISDGVNK
jgi:hypothetical protein